MMLFSVYNSFDVTLKGDFDYSIMIHTIITFIIVKKKKNIQ